MTVYILHEYPIAIADGSKPCIMTADNEPQLHRMASIIHADKDKFNDVDGALFYVISRSQMKIAVNNGALRGRQADNMIRFKKLYPEMQQYEEIK